MGRETAPPVTPRMAMELSDARFRSSPVLELKRLADLSPQQREAFRELESDDQFYGLLVPRRQGTANIRSVEKQTAELFRGLAEPQTIDPRLLADENERQELIDLVLDGILEVEHDGVFVRGAEAFPLLCAADADRPHSPGGDAVAQLSLEALQYAQELESTDPAALTRAVYFYNRLPISPAWRTRFPGRAAMLDYLGVASGPLAARMETHWMLLAEGQSNGWLSWNSREHRQQRGAAMYKLYVSPRPERIRDAFEAVVRVLAEIPGASFKIGPTAAGILRPDKLVTYFDSRQDMDAAAIGLRRELDGCPAHGIPFTAGIGGDGLLSWGVDPPESERKLSWIGRESWRLWVANRLGAALATAKSSRPPLAASFAIEPWRFAMERVRRQGVDIERWVPGPSLWSAA